MKSLPYIVIAVLATLLVASLSRRPCKSPEGFERTRTAYSRKHKVMAANEIIRNNLERAQDTGNDLYFALAEKDMESHWKAFVWPYISGADFTHVLEIACGHCRNTNKLKDLAKRISAIDINPSNVEYCKERFAGNNKLRFYTTDGLTVPSQVEPSITFVYSFDAMVHFDAAVVANYLEEAERVMVPGATGYFHHSQSPRCPETLSTTGFCSNPDTIGDDPANPHRRNAMSKAQFAEAARRVGLEIVRQVPVVWDPNNGETDCVSVFRKPL